MTDQICYRLWRKPNRKNNVIDHIDAVYVKNETNMLWSMGLDVDYDENQIRQQRD